MPWGRLLSEGSLFYYVFGCVLSCENRPLMFWKMRKKSCCNTWGREAAYGEKKKFCDERMELHNSAYARLVVLATPGFQSQVEACLETPMLRGKNNLWM